MSPRHSLLFVMDNVTHALAGALLAAGTVALLEQRVARRGTPVPSSMRGAALAVGLITAELPDGDLVYAGSAMGMGKLGYMLHHRGHTHTVLFALAGALLVWGALLLIKREWRTSPMRWPMLGLALVGTLSHLLLDFTNSYGVHPFWPFENSWYYGDAVFIVEPWLFVVALPPLFLLARRVSGKVLYALLLALILAAAWWVDMVPRDVAIALTVGTLLWSAAVRVMRAERRAGYAIAAWCLVEVTWFGASSVAERRVRNAVGASFRDVVLNAGVANPLCFSALVVEVEGETYRVTAASVATFPVLRSVAKCVSADRGGATATGAGSNAVIHVDTESASLRWGNSWSSPRAELQQLAATNCEVAAALRFVRVPVWKSLPSGALEFGDERYGGANGGFATIESRPPVADCPAYIPDWIPPRHDILGELSSPTLGSP